jgi:hypothetical protein
MDSTARLIVAMPDWMGYLGDNIGSWGQALDTGPCFENVFPSGWGGAVTDSITQGVLAGPGIQGGEGNLIANKVFVKGYSDGEQNFHNVKLVELNDVVRVPVLADGGNKAGFLSVATMAYPDICCAECSGVAYYNWGGWPPPDPCYDCLDDCLGVHANVDWAHDPDLKKASAPLEGHTANCGVEAGEEFLVNRNADWYGN